MVLRYYIPRLAQCLPVAHHGNWVPCDPRLNCAGSRSGLEPQRYCAHGPLVCGIRPGTYQSNHLLPCRLCFFRQRLRESTLKENPVWSPVGRLAVMAGSWQVLQLMKYSDYSTMCFSWFPSEAERRVMMLGNSWLYTSCPGYISANPKVVDRWVRGDGGRCRMALGAASHKLASTRLEPSGRLILTWGNMVIRQQLWMTEQPCLGSALLPPLWGRA